MWSYNEFVALSGEEADLWAAYLDVTPEGNWEGENIIHRRFDDIAFAKEHHLNLDQLQERWRTFRSILYDARAPRIRPGLDDKVILSWNALMIDALISAYKTFGEPNYLARAERAMSFLESHMRTGEGPGSVFMPEDNPTSQPSWMILLFCFERRFICWRSITMTGM